MSSLESATSAFHRPAQRNAYRRSYARLQSRFTQDRARIVFDCRMANDPATINKQSTNENNTDVDRWADARRLRIQWKTMFVIVMRIVM
jgi:hypothetical protein